MNDNHIVINILLSTNQYYNFKVKNEEIIRFSNEINNYFQKKL